MSEVESVGEIVTGGLIASAVEPGAGGVGLTGEGVCLNCGARLAGSFCAACGQKSRVHRSLATFLHDMIQGLFNFEGKIWRTLPLLVWRPGEMTRRYVDGQRARFISPVALYLFTVFLMFAVLNFSGAMAPGAKGMQANFDIAATEERAAIAKLEAERMAGLAKGANVAAIDRRIAAKKEEVAQLEGMQRGEIIQIDGTKNDDTPRWMRAVVQRAQANPELAVAKVQDAASKFSWLLIPLSVPFLWLLFPFNRRYHLYDHTVFVTYSLSFMMMLAISAGLLVSIGAPSLASLLFFVPPIHMYRQLKGAYGLSRISAVLRTMLLLSFAFVTAILFFVAIFTIGIL
ncbi:MAG: DUF3667 domain-containing protein [Sphingomicrobium sp.]